MLKTSESGLCQPLLRVSIFGCSEKGHMCLSICSSLVVLTPYSDRAGYVYLMHSSGAADNVQAVLTWLFSHLYVNLTV